MKRHAALAAWVLLMLAVPAGAETARSGQPVMGTILTVTVVAEGRGHAQALADAAVEEARLWDDALTIWRPEGELARFNARAGSGDVEVGPRLTRGLAAMLALARSTGGAFDPAVGSLRLVPGAPARPVIGVERVLRLDTSRARLERGSALDPGAVGKGLALDAIVELLKSRGVTSAFLDFGGSSQTAIGASPDDAAGWPVLIAGWAPGSSHGILKLRDASLSTSRAGATDTTPVLDPRNGLAVAAPRLATVLTRSATDADAWSTALVVLGREGLDAASAHALEAMVEDAHGVARTAGFEVSK